MLVSSECADRSPEIQPTDYTNPALRMMFVAIVATQADDVEVTPATVATRLERAGEIDRVGGQASLVKLASEADVDNFDDHVDALIRDAKRTAVKTKLTEVIERLQDPDVDLDAVGSETVDDVEREVSSRAKARGTTSAQAVTTAINSFFARSNNPRMPGTPTSIDSLNLLLRMLQADRLHVLGARPNVGKTAMGLNFVDAASVVHGIPSIVWSLEMPPAENTGRLITTRSNVSASVWQEGSKMRGDVQAFIRAAARVAGAPITWGEAQTLPEILVELGAWLRDPKTKERLAKANEDNAIRDPDTGDMVNAAFQPLAMVDHLHAIPKKGMGTIEFVDYATGTLKRAALKHHIPILLLAQLNRDNVKEGRPPRITDFRGGGAIEEWADAGMVIDRDVNGENPHLAELILDKNRGGKTGRVSLTWEGHHQRFLEREE